MWNGSPGRGHQQPATIRAYHNGFNDNGEGVYARGNSVFEIAWNEITGNSVYGIHRVNPAIVRTFSPATNVVSDNAASDPPNEVVPLQRVSARRVARGVRGAR